MLKKTYRKILNYCPLPALIIFITAIISGLIHLTFYLSAPFADFFNRYISSVIRMVLAKLTNIFPFSLAETIFLFIPVLAVILIVSSVKASGKDARVTARYTCSLLSVTALLYSLFSIGFAAGYRGSTLDRKLGLERQDVSAEDLENTARILLSCSQELVDDIFFRYGSSSIMPYSLSEMGHKVNSAYEAVAGKYDFVTTFRSNIKFILLSEPMTYTHISGVYTYFTGEANINTNFPDYTLPFTAAHELSHQRGIAREDEANFMAFLVCIESNDPYIKYSGYFNMYEYVISALYEADRKAYYSVISDMDYKLRYELIAYSDFFDKYKDSVAADISLSINDNYLKSQGETEGSRSYGEVVDLAVAYYK